MSIPILEIDGEVYTQTFPIIAYLGKKYGLAAEDEYDNFHIHECCDDFRDFFNKWRPILMESTPPTQKEVLKKKLLAEDTQQIMSKYNEILVKNNAQGSPWLFGNKMTWADISFAHFIHNFKISLAQVDLVAGFPVIENFCRNVHNQPRIKEWIDKRPDSPFWVVHFKVRNIIYYKIYKLVNLTENLEINAMNVLISN